jgi:hypothetical protein
MKPTTIAVDLAKNVFEIAVSHHPGRVAKRHRLSRTRLQPFFAQQPQATVLLEACASAHHWSRQLHQLGHHVVLLPPRHVRPYRCGNKTDRADAKALLEAFRNDQIRPVPVKSVEQQTLAALHRPGSGLSSKTPTHPYPKSCGRLWLKPATTSASSRCVSTTSNDSSRPSNDSSPLSPTCAPSQASDY